MARGRTLAEFQKEFPDEASCAAFLYARRWPDGFVCPKCGKGRAAALKSRPRLFECLDCGRQTSLTAGTALHRSKLPLTTWFWAAHVMATHSNGMSARQLEDQLGVTYKTAWLVSQKLRRSMIDPDRDLLEGVVEVDQTEIPFRVGDAFFEPGAAGKILIAGAVELIDRGAGKAKPRRRGEKYLDTRSGRLRLAVIADNSANSIEAFVRANVKPRATLLTDGHASYPGLSGGSRHDGQLSQPQGIPQCRRGRANRNFKLFEFELDQLDWRCADIFERASSSGGLPLEVTDVQSHFLIRLVLKRLHEISTLLNNSHARRRLCNGGYSLTGLEDHTPPANSIVIDNRGISRDLRPSRWRKAPGLRIQYLKC
jgi:transposase-like protein